MMASVIETGTALPDLHLTDSRGAAFFLGDVLAKGPAVVYFMRAADCPMCRMHVGKLAAHYSEIRSTGAEVVVVVPDGPKEAGALAVKKSLLFPVVAGEAGMAHEELGLTRSVGMRRSGTVVVNQDGTVRYVRSALMPTGGFDLPGLLAVLR